MLAMLTVRAAPRAIPSYPMCPRKLKNFEVVATYLNIMMITFDLSFDFYQRGIREKLLNFLNLLKIKTEIEKSSSLH